jgi:putative oxidoreductase
MKIAVLIARLLLGLIFFVFGLNGILHFLPMPAMPPSDAATFSSILMHHGYMTFVALLMVISGLLLLVGRFVPLALTMLGPILVNILLYHALLDPAAGVKAAIPGIVATVLEVFLIVVYRRSFYTLFYPAPEVL